jgi:sulfite reductase beta subunit-like hemoprotein
MDDLGFSTDMCGQGFSGARYGDPRNIVCCPVSGIDHHELINGAPLLHQLSDFLIGNPAFQDMPRKFKFAISGCGCDCTRAISNDLAFVAVTKNRRVGYTVLAGGSVGSSLPGPRLAQPLGIFLPPKLAFDVAIATIALHREHSSRESKSKARFKWLLHNWGHAKLVAMLEDKLGHQFERYEGPPFSRKGIHEGSHQQRQNHFSFLHIPVLGGILSADDLTNLADVADTYGNGDIRLTPTQNVIIPYVKDMAACVDTVAKMGYALECSHLRWNSMGCASDFCGKTVAPHAKELNAQLVERLETRFTSDVLDRAGLRIHVSGCPNNCCANVISEIGLAGRLTRKDGALKQYYHILLGGSYGTAAIQGRVIKEDVPAARVVSELEQVVARYSLNKTPNESFGDFCRRQSRQALHSYLNTSE